MQVSMLLNEAKENLAYMDIKVTIPALNETLPEISYPEKDSPAEVELSKIRAVHIHLMKQGHIDIAHHLIGIIEEIQGQVAKLE